MSDERCPECGARHKDLVVIMNGADYECGSWSVYSSGYFNQSDACRIRELEAKLAAALEKNSSEYQRGRRDQESATKEQSPTWGRDVVPLRKKLAAAEAGLTEAVGLLRKTLRCGAFEVDKEIEAWLAQYDKENADVVG